MAVKIGLTAALQSGLERQRINAAATIPITELNFLYKDILRAILFNELDRTPPDTPINGVDAYLLIIGGLQNFTSGYFYMFGIKYDPALIDQGSIRPARTITGKMPQGSRTVYLGAMTDLQYYAPGYAVYMINFIKGAPGFKQVLTLRQWYEYFSYADAGIDYTIGIKTQDAVNYWLAFGKYIESQMTPDEYILWFLGSDLPISQLSARAAFWAKIFTVVTLTLLTFGVIHELPDNVVTDAIDTKINEITTKAIDNINLVDIGSEILSDTVQDQLNILRNEVTQKIRKLDEDTDFNLSSLTDAWNETSAATIKEVVSFVHDGTVQVLNNIVDSMAAIENRLLDSEAHTSEIQLQLNKETGRGFAEALFDLIFVRKGTL